MTLTTEDKTMRNRVVSCIVSAVALAAVGLPGAAGAARPRTLPVKHHLTATAMLVTLSSTKGFPAPGSSQVVLTLGHCNPGGKVVAVNYLTITRQRGTVFTYSGTTIDYFATGSLRSTAGGTFTPQSNGSITTTGRGRFEGGTGAFRHATGTYTFTGVQPAGSSVLTDHSTGTLTY